MKFETPFPICEPLPFCSKSISYEILGFVSEFNTFEQSACTCVTVKLSVIFSFVPDLQTMQALSVYPTGVALSAVIANGYEDSIDSFVPVYGLLQFLASLSSQESVHFVPE